MIARVDRSAVELLIFMCVNKLLAGTGDPPGMIYPAGYGSGKNSPPMTGISILVVPNFYDGDGSERAIPNGDLPIAILISDIVVGITDWSVRSPRRVLTQPPNGLI